MNRFSTRASWLFVLPVLLLFASCKKDALTKNLDVKLDGTIDLNVGGGDPLSGVWLNEIDPNSNADVRDNRSKIKEVVIERLTYWVEDYSGGGATIGSGDWRYYPSGSPGEITTLSSITGANFQDLKTSAAEQPIPLSETAKAKLIQLIKDGKKITLAFEGGVSDKPTWTRFKLRLYTKVKVGI